MAKKRTFKEFKQGIYKPTNREKCLNKVPVVYRSFLEARLFRVLDRSSNVLEWSSEQVIIPYKNPVKSAQEGETVYSRYFVDVYMKMTIGEEVKKFIVEIKPFAQTQPPKPSKKKKTSTVIYENAQWSVNQAKWEAARKWAEKKGMDFLIITEKNIEILEQRK